MPVFFAVRWYIADSKVDIHYGRQKGREGDKGGSCLARHFLLPFPPFHRGTMATGAELAVGRSMRSRECPVRSWNSSKASCPPLLPLGSSKTV